MQQLLFQENAIQSFIRENSVNSLFDNAMKSIVDGDRNPLEIMQAFKLMSDTYDRLNKADAFKDAVMCEAARHITASHGDKRPAVFNGFEMFFSTNVQTDYNDATLLKLKAKVKERENFLKALTEPKINRRTGEVTAEPPTYRVKKTLVMTKPKPKPQGIL